MPYCMGNNGIRKTVGSRQSTVGSPNSAIDKNAKHNKINLKF